MKNKPTFKRVCAYIIDIAVVAFIFMLFSKIELLNPNAEEYDKVYDEFTTYVEKNSTTSDGLKNIMSGDEYKNFSYRLAKLQIPNSILNIVITFGYFVVFQYLNKGQTIGKRLMKIRVKSKNGKRASFVQILVRSLLINEIIASIILVIFISTMSQSMYLQANRIVELIDMLIVYGSLGFIMFRPDACGLHDLLMNTVVVSDQKEVSEEKEETVEPKKANVKEAKVSGEKTKKSNVKKTVKKDE